MSQNANDNAPSSKALEEKLAQIDGRLDGLEHSLRQLMTTTRVVAETQAKGIAQIERSMQQLLIPLHISLSKLKSTTQLVSRNVYRGPREVIRVIFLVHNVETWNALDEIYRLMLEHERFEPVVVTLKRDFLNAQRFGQEEINYNGLMQLGIKPIRFNSNDPVEELELLKLMNPDIIFRQAPWDISIQPEFRYNEINFAKVCMVPYGFGSVAMQDEHYNHHFMRNCWRIYAESPLALDRARDFIFDSNMVVAGTPKFDQIIRAKSEAAWPLPIGPDKIRIIWAPHHSMTADWLNFSTFRSNYKHFLQLARECPHLDIVFKPHPALLEKVVAYGFMTQPDLRSYLEEFLALPNTAMVTNGDYAPLFWGSDILITDGIGFFGEYMVTGKPIIWTENPGHFPFNPIGEMLQEGMYRAGDFEAVVGYLEQLCVEKQDPLKEKREEIIKRLLPRPEGSAQFIVNDLLNEMDKL
ncbi:CDP-glycerol glycerophosphotransferase family protein [Herbaspirillum frisingense]|uniref:CDP-glycerol glycerophosphotransferase family protein n=1 Tax=Herbaspirillum frisingense TaxID=92645 RepID=UPI001F23C552|nr:CDP-glycerol glycerophosphotransferase family protein [Herbaspirillum frisingense]UIN21135.1 CDP-glycerol glycerophosphotransferase family protein [Herbaspirillum frisingense]